MSYAPSVTGFLILSGVPNYAAVLMHMPTQWIVVGSVVLVGLAILTGVKATRQKDPN